MVAECGGSTGDCATTAAEVARLEATRSGNHVELRWQPDPLAAGYNLWYVTDKREIDNARLM